MLKVKSAWTDSYFLFCKASCQTFFFMRKSYFFGLIFQFLGKCGYLPSPPAPHNYCWFFCVFPSRSLRRLLIPPASRCQNPNSGRPWVWKLRRLPTTHPTLSLTPLTLVTRTPTPFSVKAGNFHLTPPSLTRPPVGAESWKVQSTAGSRPPPLSPEGFNLHTCLLLLRESPTLPPGGSRVELVSQASASAPAASPARAPSPGQSPAALVRPHRAARAAPSAVPPPSVAVPTPLQKRVLVTPSSERGYLLREAVDTCGRHTDTRSLLRRPDPSGEELCSREGGLQGGGSLGRLGSLARVGN